MSEHGQPNIHKAELLACGCRVDPITGAAFIVCAQHAIPFADLPEQTSKRGLKPLCPFCASQQLRPEADAFTCLACGEEFAFTQIAGFGLSVDSKPTQCQKCMAITYSACSCNQAGP